MNQPTEAEIKAWERNVAIRKKVLLIGLLSIPILLIVALVIESQRTPTVVTVPDSQTNAASSNSSSESGEYSGYAYTFTRQGESVQAVFYPRFLPRNDSIFIGATRDVIRRAYNEEASGSPSLIGRAIRFDGASHAFMVTPIKEDTGEIHSLVIAREPKK